MVMKVIKIIMKIVIICIINKDDEKYNFFSSEFFIWKIYGDLNWMTL